MIINLSSAPGSDLTTSLSLQWIIEPVPEPGPWPLYKIFLAKPNDHLQSGNPVKENSPLSLGLKPANEVKESLYVVDGLQPDHWFIFPLKPQEPNVYAYVSWRVVTTRTRCSQPYFDQDLQEAPVGGSLLVTPDL